MEQRQKKLGDTPGNYISAEYNLYDWQKNHCTHVKNWCKCQKAEHYVVMLQPENERTRKRLSGITVMIPMKIYADLQRYFSISYMFGSFRLT